MKFLLLQFSIILLLISGQVAAESSYADTNRLNDLIENLSREEELKLRRLTSVIINAAYLSLYDIHGVIDEYQYDHPETSDEFIALAKSCALIEALRKNQSAISEYLLIIGANPDVKVSTKKMGFGNLSGNPDRAIFYVLHARQLNVQLVKILQKYDADFRVKNDKQQNLIHVTIEQTRGGFGKYDRLAELVDIFLEERVTPYATDKWGMYPIDYLSFLREELDNKILISFINYKYDFSKRDPSRRLLTILKNARFDYLLERVKELGGKEEDES